MISNFGGICDLIVPGIRKWGPRGCKPVRSGDDLGDVSIQFENGETELLFTNEEIVSAKYKSLLKARMIAMRDPPGLRLSR